MLEHRYDIRRSKSCIDPNPLMVERQDSDNLPRLQMRERCAKEIAAYVLIVKDSITAKSAFFLLFLVDRQSLSVN